MKQVYVKLDVVYGFFGFVKPFEKQQFEKRLYAIMPDKSEYGANESVVKDAFATAINMLYRIWNDSTRRSLVAQIIEVLISFNNDYSTWKVDVWPYGGGLPLEERHPDFTSFAEKETNQIFEKYGFAEEKKPPKKFAVAYMGRKTIMDEKQYDDFIKDIIKMYPKSWYEMTRSIKVEQDA